MDYNLHMQLFADTKFERKFGSKGYVIIGLDEVGRGALAGPIAVGATVFGPFQREFDFMALEQLKIKDSKLLHFTQRERLAKVIKQHALFHAVAFSPVAVINKKGIVFAFEQAARKAITQVQQNLQTDSPIFLLVDAFKIPYVKGVGHKRQLNIIKGDVHCLSIAAASILAKVERDYYMTQLAKGFPMYEWNHNKGYGTREHIAAILKHGSSRHHRPLYLRKILGQ